jgi:hypothetical protein
MLLMVDIITIIYLHIKNLGCIDSVASLCTALDNVNVGYDSNLLCLKENVPNATYVYDLNLSLKNI